jgi:hypothetical protein
MNEQGGGAGVASFEGEARGIIRGCLLRGRAGCYSVMMILRPGSGPGDAAGVPASSKRLLVSTSEGKPSRHCSSLILKKWEALLGVKLSTL